MTCLLYFLERMVVNSALSVYSTTWLVSAMDTGFLGEAHELLHYGAASANCESAGAILKLQGDSK